MQCDPQINHQLTETNNPNAHKMTFFSFCCVLSSIYFNENEFNLNQFILFHLLNSCHFSLLFRCYCFASTLLFALCYVVYCTMFALYI